MKMTAKEVMEKITSTKEMIGFSIEKDGKYFAMNDGNIWKIEFFKNDILDVEYYYVRHNIDGSDKHFCSTEYWNGIAFSDDEIFSEIERMSEFGDFVELYK